MECYEAAYLLYQNKDTKISFSNILFIYGEKDEIITQIFRRHKEDLKHYHFSNDPIFEKVFFVENIFQECKNHLID